MLDSSTDRSMVVRRSVRRISYWVMFATAVVIPVLFSLGFFGAGNQLFVIKTPSMGTAMPVGTLAVVHEEEDYKTGQVITFKVDGRTYTRRIVEIFEDGRISTQGDLNGVVDAWRITQADVIGAVRWSAPGLGFLLIALPWLMLAGLLLEVIARARWSRGKKRLIWDQTSRQHRWSTRIFGWSLTVAVIGFVLRPWANALMLGYRTGETGVLMNIVNTGVLPLSHEGTRLRSGERAEFLVTEIWSDGLFRLNLHLALESWQYVLLLALCITPTVLSLIPKSSSEVPVPKSKRALLPPSILRRLVPAAVLAMAVLGVAAILGTTFSGATLTAAVQNSSTVAGTNESFYCRQQIAERGASNTYFAYAFDSVTYPSSGTSGFGVSDTSAAGVDGTIYRTTTSGSWPTTTASGGCTRNVPPTALHFSGGQCVWTNNAVGSPEDFTLSLWFRTPTTSTGGRLLGLANGTYPGTGGGESSYDRHLYLGNDGRLHFGTYKSGTRQYVTTSTSYFDNQWHHVVATQSSSGGMHLYLDGILVGKNTTYTTAHNYGSTVTRWKMGCGGASGWTGLTSPYFTGDLQYVAAYRYAFTAAEVTAMYNAR